MIEIQSNEYLEHQQPVKSDSLLKLSELANQQRQLELELAKLESKMEETKESIKNISEQLIPELMEEIGMEEFTTSTGLSIKIQEKIHAGITKDNKPNAIKWLIDNGFSSVVKNEVRVSFSKEEFDKAHALAEQLRSDKLPALEDQSVHAMTLKSLVTECLKTGVNIPLDLFSVHRQRVAKIN